MEQAGLDSGSLATYATFGTLLKFLRRRAGLTQRELGTAVGYSETQITRLERDSRQPDPATVEALFVDALGLRRESAAARRLIDLARGAHVASHDDLIPGQLPAPLTRFVGREYELAEVTRLLGENRLVTLTGSGGVGKTRLAVEVGAMHRPRHPDRPEPQGAAAPRPVLFPDGMWLAELAPLSNPGLVADMVATALGLAGTNRPALDVLIDHLRNKQALLLLDNCEHLIDASAKLVEALLSTCSRLRILATSREALNIPGEVRWRVPPLAPAEGVVLFAERARDARPDIVLGSQNALAVKAICARLDGIPLAIELAAARLSGLSLEDLAARLDDRFHLLTGGNRTALSRQQTLRATIDWSYNLLSEQEQALLRRLAVFAGGLTAASAEQVCAGLCGCDTLALLLNLVNKSLVVANADERLAETRYSLLDTVRRYAWERLQGCAEKDDVRRQHARYFLAFVQENAPPDMRRTRAPVHGLMAECLPWLQRLELERDNLRAALAWCLRESHEARDMDTGVQLALWLFVFWSIRGSRLEGREWLERALARTDPSARTQTRARLLCALVDFVQRTGQSALAEALAREALAICRELGDRYDLMIALWRFADLAHVSAAELRNAIEEWLSIAQDLKDASYIGRALSYLGDNFRNQGDLPQAAALYDESLAALPEHEAGLRHIARYFQGSTAWEMQGGEHGLAQVHESLAHFREAGFELGIIHALNWLGDRALRVGDLAQARQHLREGLQVAYRDGAWVMVAGCLASLADLAAKEGQPARAATLWSAALANNASVSSLAHRMSIDAARSELDEHALTAAETAGRAMSYERAVEYALAV